MECHYIPHKCPAAKADDGSAKLPGLHDEGLAEIIRAAFPEVVAEDEKKDSEEEKKVEDKEETSA